MFPTFFISENIIPSDTILVLCRNPRITYYKKKLISYRMFSNIFWFCVANMHHRRWQSVISNPEHKYFTNIYILSYIAHFPFTDCNAQHTITNPHSIISSWGCQQENWNNPQVTDICPQKSHLLILSFIVEPWHLEIYSASPLLLENPPDESGCS